MSEVDFKDLTPKFIERLTKLYLKNVSEKSKCESRAHYCIATPKEKAKIVDIWAEMYKWYFNYDEIKPDMSILVARDNKGCIQGLCITHANIEIPCTNETTLYVNSLFTNKKI